MAIATYTSRVATTWPGLYRLAASCLLQLLGRVMPTSLNCQRYARGQRRSPGSTQQLNLETRPWAKIAFMGTLSPVDFLALPTPSSLHYLG